MPTDSATSDLIVLPTCHNTSRAYFDSADSPPLSEGIYNAETASTGGMWQAPVIAGDISMKSMVKH